MRTSHGRPAAMHISLKPGVAQPRIPTTKFIHGYRTEARLAYFTNRWTRASSQTAPHHRHTVRTPLHADWQRFQNYPGVESQERTETELQGHLDKRHLAALGTHEELSKLVGGEPVLSKIGLIVKTRNNVTKARMILDTKQSVVKHVTAKTQRVILPRLFDAIFACCYYCPC